MVDPMEKKMAGSSEVHIKNLDQWWLVELMHEKAVFRAERLKKKLACFKKTKDGVVKVTTPSAEQASLGLVKGRTSEDTGCRGWMLEALYNLKGQIQAGNCRREGRCW